MPTANRRSPSGRMAGFALARCLILVLGFGLAAAAQAAVDANTATTVELEAITGIGPALAARIVEERRKSPFRSLDELRSRVRGVGEANLRKMRDSGLTVGAGSGASGAQTIVGGVGRAAPAQAPRAGGIRHELR